MKRLYFDTETTGFPSNDQEKWPHIVQIAAILVDDDAGEVASMNFIIRPDGWEVPEDVAKIHGITTEKALMFGISVRAAMGMFSQLCRVTQQVVAHNIEFDLKIVSYELTRLNAPYIAMDRERVCTMLATTDLCKLPGRYPGKYKWPKLIEAHQHLFGEGFDGAHDALVDVRACARIHKHLITTQEK